MTEFKYPLYKKSKASGLIVRFDSLTSGTIFDVGTYTSGYAVGQHMNDWTEHTDNSIWDDVTDKFVISTDVEYIYPLYKKSKITGLVVRFDSQNSGEVINTGKSKTYSVGEVLKNWCTHTDFDMWEDFDFKGIVANAKSTQKGGLKFDAGKLRYSLVPYCAFKGMAEVLTFGADKYEANSWQNVEDAKERYLNALYRHIESYRIGETKDSESGISHLSHAMTNCAFLLHFEELEATKNER